MTSFCHQLRLLLWKNYILRKRHKMRIVLEILWPLMLFLILMWVRTRGLRIPRPACHLIEKAMPSVGGFEFLQNFMCGLNNTCYDNVDSDGNPMWVEDDGGKVVWENATLPKFVQEATPPLERIATHPKSVQTSMQLMQDMKTVMSGLRLEGIRRDFKKKGSVELRSFLKSDGEEKFLKKLEVYGYFAISRLEALQLLDTEIHLDKFNKANYDEVRFNILGDDGTGNCGDLNNYKLFSMNQTLYEKICNLSVGSRKFVQEAFEDEMDMDGANYRDMVRLYKGNAVAVPNGPTLLGMWAKYDSTVLQNMIDFIRILGKFSEGTVDRSNDLEIDDEAKMQSANWGVATGTKMLYKAFCGIQLSENATRPGIGDDRTNQFDSLRDRLRDWRTRRRYKPDPEISQICNSIFEQLESRPLTNVLWRQVKPFVRGRLLYYPRTTFTEDLMQRVDEKFSELKELENVLSVLLSMLHRTRAWMSDNMDDLLTIQNSSKEPNSPLDDLVSELENMFFLASKIPFFGRAANLPNRDQLRAMVDTFKTFDFNATSGLLARTDFASEIESEVLNCIRYNKSISYWTNSSEKEKEYFKSEDDAVANGLELMPDSNLWAVIIFLDIPEDGTSPHHLKYKIRMDSDKVDGTRVIHDRITRKSPRRRPSIDLKYITNGFIYIQEMIEQSFVEEQTGVNQSEIGILLQQFPFPCFIFDQFIRAISNTFPLFMVLSWVYASAMLIKSIVLEKELRLKEVMKVMGCGNSVIWTAWFIDSFIVMTFSCVILSVILKYGNIITHSDFTVIFVFLIIFSIATICFSFLVSTFFTKANSAAAAGGIIFFVTYLPYNFMLIWEDRLTWYYTLSSCLFSNVAFGFGCTYIARLEEDGLGAQWNRISINTLPGDDFNFSYCVLMLIFDSILYLLLAFYIEAVFPGENGMPRKWYFLFQKTFWCSKLTKNHDIDGDGYKNYTDPSNNPVVEKDPEGLRCGVSVRHLCKKYPNGRIALADLNMSFYEDQITSFLGHNGAGKTTTISILTGLFPPSEGTAFIYDRDIKSDIDIIRRDVGICPQHNVLFDRLTVAEHMIFYADLKGKKDIVKQEMEQMLGDLGIPHKKDEFPNNLSGGMKRKLSVAIAFVGGSRTVFLDEPTSGVDPYSRRSIWELLLKYKSGRTIILTTHFMDEADLLGDRIAIISRGQLKACGTSLFLKAQFGQGYFIRLVREIEEAPAEELLINNIPPSTVPFRRKSQLSRNSSRQTTSTRHVELYSGFIRRRIPEARLISDIGSDVVFLLPTKRVNDFQILFKDLDDNLEELKVRSYGISDTTLEDVFLQITVEDLELASTGNDHPNRTCQNYCFSRKLWSAMRRSLKRKKRKSYQAINIPSEPVKENFKQKGSNSRKVSPELQKEPRLQSQIENRENDESISTATPSEDTAAEESRVPAIISSKFNSAVDLSETETETENEEAMAPLTRRKSSFFAIKRTNIQASVYVQFWVIILKRFRNSNRNRKSIFFEIIVPALFIALTLACTLILPPPANEKNREVTFKAYTYKSPNNIFFSIPKNPIESFENTLTEMTSRTGIGNPCVEDKLPEKLCNGHWSQTAVDNFKTESNNIGNVSLGQCSCASGAQMCDANMERPPPPKFVTPTRDYILNVSKYHLPEWVSKTYRQYDTKRYGGYEMLIRDPEEYTIGDFVRLLDGVTKFQIVDKKNASKPRAYYKVWYENRGWISNIAYLNGLNNMLLRQHLSSGEQKNSYGITLNTHPMNLTKEQQQKESLKTAALGVIHAICVIFALSFVPASFTVYLIEERKSGAKHLHLVSGVKPFVYWCSNFFFDMSKYLFSALLCVLLFVAFQAEAYISRDSWLAFVTLLFLYGWASIPLMYPASFMFSIPSTAFVALACANLFIGIVTTVSTFVLDQLGDQELKDISDILQQVFLIFPHYCLGRGLMELVKLHIQATAFGKFNLDDFHDNRFQWSILGKLLTCLAIQGLIFFVFTILIEYRQWVYLCCCKKKLNQKKKKVQAARLGADEQDEDVQREANRIINHPPRNSFLLAENLSKIYSGKTRPAVNNLCFAVDPGECFGLLGVNGAGKSTTFKMLTGDERITSGKAFIMGFDVEKSLDSARKHYGYCPQEDGIDPLLNAYEQLELYGRLRGLTLEEVRETARLLISSLGLTRYAKKRCGTYSGGNKRKVSTAIALIGNPDVVFLDEPTSGMDPGARRQLWKLIIAVTRLGKSVILTSHSMEECEALCSRLAIMVNGKFTCMGSLQHLKNRFGKGYRLSVRCPVAIQPEFMINMESTLPFAKLEDLHCTQLKFNIPQEDVKLREIFAVMCAARLNGLIEDFSVSQTTLDDIFIKFANEQSDELDRHTKVTPIVPQSSKGPEEA